MLLSVIIPTYNRAQLLPRAIESVLCQPLFSDPLRAELIVVDDGSSDDTELIITNQYPQIHYLKQNNKGVSAARNLGLEKAKGEWIALLDSDDEWLPDKLQRQLALLQSSQLDVCHTEEIWIRNDVRVNQMNKHKKAGGAIFEHCLPLCAMSPSSIIIHQRVFEHIGFFDESLPACEDYDLWLRLSAHYKVAYVEEPCIKKYGGHDDQLSRAFWGMDRFRVLALENLLLQDKPELALNAEQRAQALTMLNKKNNILLNGARKHGNALLQEQCQARLERFTVL